MHRSFSESTFSTESPNTRWILPRSQANPPRLVPRYIVKSLNSYESDDPTPLHRNLLNKTPPLNCCRWRNFLNENFYSARLRKFNCTWSDLPWINVRSCLVNLCASWYRIFVLLSVYFLHQSVFCAMKCILRKERPVYKIVLVESRVGIERLASRLSFRN